MAKNADCSSTPDPFHAVMLEKAGVLVDIRWQWDGVSVRPNCDGPVLQMRVRNNTGGDRWAQLPRARGGTRAVLIQPGTDRTLTQAQCVAVGLETYVDIQGVAVTTTP